MMHSPAFLLGLFDGYLFERHEKKYMLEGWIINPF